jgi:sugar/nucleoside kinase (ribokinase family)
VVLKRGAAGARLLASDTALDCPAFPVTVQDPTGAGDAFCGGVLAGLLRFGDLRQALACGTASASFAVEAVGLAGLIGADRTEVERRADWVAARIVAHDGTQREEA